MKRVSGGSRRMGGTGMRGISRSSMRSRTSFSAGRNSTSLLKKYSHVNRHHSHMYRRHYGNSVLPVEMRIIAYIVLAIIALIIIFS